MAGPDPPTGVMVEANGCSSAIVAWTPTPSRICDVRIEGYSVRYQLNSSTGGYTTVNTSSASVTLQDLVPNAGYTMDVAAIYSNGEMSTYSAETSLIITGNTYTQGLCSACICIIYSTVGRSIANIYDHGAIFTEVRSAVINMAPRSDIEAMDRPNVLYVIYRMVSAQQTNLLRKTAGYF